MQDFIFEVILNLIGLAISGFIARFAYSGYSVIQSPNLLRLMFAFVFVAIGFAILMGSLFVSSEYSQAMLTIGLGAQTVGYFFIAMSHSLKKSFDFAPTVRLAIIPLALGTFIIPGNSLEHLVRSISFILLVYVSIETMASYMQSRKSSTLMIGSGLGALAAAELMAWYNFIYPGVFYYPALSIKVAGFAMMFVPFSRFGIVNGLGGRGKVNP
jgi:hypothetical protein